jgi:hypothetical protein
MIGLVHIDQTNGRSPTRAHGEWQIVDYRTTKI